MLTKVRKSPKSIPKRPSDRICGDWEVNVLADLAKSCSQICYGQMLKCIQYTDIIHILGDGHQSIKWDLYPHHKASVVRVSDDHNLFLIYIYYYVHMLYVPCFNPSTDVSFLNYGRQVLLGFAAVGQG